MAGRGDLETTSRRVLRCQALGQAGVLFEHKDREQRSPNCGASTGSGPRVNKGHPEPGRPPVCGQHSGGRWPCAHARPPRPRLHLPTG